MSLIVRCLLISPVLPFSARVLCYMRLAAAAAAVAYSMYGIGLGLEGFWVAAPFSVVWMLACSMFSEYFCHDGISWYSM